MKTPAHLASTIVSVNGKVVHSGKWTCLQSLDALEDLC